MKILMSFFCFIIFLAACGSKKEGIYIIYEPFEIKKRMPTGLDELRSRPYTDSILDKKTISNIIDKYEEVVNSDTIEKVKRDQIGPKIICDYYKYGIKVKTFYYVASYSLHSKGYTYFDDNGLLDTLLLLMHSDEKFREKMDEEYRRRHHGESIPDSVKKLSEYIRLHRGDPKTKEEPIPLHLPPPPNSASLF